jgi:hypothetical protein
VLNGTFLKRNAPSLPVVISRLNPLTGSEMPTVAFATAAPEGSVITPSIDPEFAPEARAAAAPDKIKPQNAAATKTKFPKKHTAKRLFVLRAGAWNLKDLCKNECIFPPYGKDL